MSHPNFKIFKYKLNAEEVQEVELPQAAQILDLDFQPGTEGIQLCLWALVVPNQPLLTRRIISLSTGEDVPDEVVENFTYLKTLQFVVPAVLVKEGEVVPKVVVMHYFIERGVAH